MKPRNLHILGAALLLLATSCGQKVRVPSEASYHSRIKSKEVRASYFKLLATPVHGPTDEYNNITIDEHEFRNVQGFAPYYIDLPEQESIVFVTGDFGTREDSIIHIYDFRNNRHLQFKTGDASGFFGEGINSTYLGKSNFVEKFDQKEMVLVEDVSENGMVRKITLDLKEQEITQVQWNLYDDRGNLTNSYLTGK